MAETAAHLVDHLIPRVKVTAVGALVSDPASLSIRFTSPATRAGVADRSPGHFRISDQASWTKAYPSRHQRRHAYPALAPP
jgi:hypothetical protein